MMNNTTIMSLLKQRDLFTVQCSYSTHNEVIKWASMWMYVDLISADACRAVQCKTSLNNADLCCGAYGLPSEVSCILFPSSLDDEAAGIRIQAADAVVTSSAGAELISLLCPQHHRYR